MSFYDGMQDMASELISEFAQGTATYTAPGLRINSWDAPFPATPVPVQAVKVFGKRKDKYTAQGLIVASDVIYVLSAFAAVPVVGAVLTINGVAHQIVMVDSPTDIPGTPIVHFVGARK